MSLPHPFKATHPIWLLTAIAALCSGLWLVFWPPTGSAAWVAVGTPLLGGGSVLVAMQLALWRATGLERAAAPAEVNAWVMLLFLGAIMAVLLGNADVMANGLDGGEAKKLSMKLAVLGLFYVILAQALRARRGNAVLEDERDREIGRLASGWGRFALVFCVIGIAVMLAFSPADKLEWATHFMIANLLVFALISGWLCEYAATVIYYWLDRRA